MRALSKVHEREPYVFDVNGTDLSVRYQPAESDTGLFGGNSNWRGPIWFPVNYPHHRVAAEVPSLLRRRLPGRMPDRLRAAARRSTRSADELAARLTRLFLKDEHGVRPVFGQYPQLQSDPHFRDYVLFYEYFHGDTGRGVGASHQTGWTGLVAKLLMPRKSEHGDRRGSQRGD